MNSMLRDLREESSDELLLRLLERLRSADDADEISLLSQEIERTVFHKQYAAAV